MKTLYLIRHAKSSKDIPGIKDKDRPLNKQGKKEAKDAGRRLKKRGVYPQAIFSSPARRALETAKIVAGKIKFSGKKIKIAPNLYYANVWKLLKIVRSMPEAADSAFLFGHNPEFLNFVNYLNPCSIQKFPTAGVFGIEFETGSWKAVSRKNGRIVFFYAAKKTRRKGLNL